jgi:hypothetical protein
VEETGDEHEDDSDNSDDDDGDGEVCDFARGVGGKRVTAAKRGASADKAAVDNTAAQRGVAGKAAPAKVVGAKMTRGARLFGRAVAAGKRIRRS